MDWSAFSVAVSAARCGLGVQLWLLAVICLWGLPQAVLRARCCAPQETSDKSVIELQQYAKKNKPNLHILSKLQEEMKRLAEERVSVQARPAPKAPPHPHPLALKGGEGHLAQPRWQLWEGSQPQHF